MAVKPLLIQISLLAGMITLPAAGFLVLLGHSPAAAGLLLGVVVGVVNQAMIAFRVARIGQIGGRRKTILFIQTGTALRYIMIGAAAIIALRQPGIYDFFGLVAGLVLTMVVGAIVGVRQVLRRP
ncbi:MAG: ATP synthase subunit I [Chloroflexota bacterium]